MDPITSATRQFLAEAEAFWRARPGCVLPLFAAPSERGDVVKALRLYESGPENRRPVFVYEEPFGDADAYDRGLSAAIQSDYDLIREGVRDEGVTLLPFPASDDAPLKPRAPMERAVLATERTAALLGDAFDGVLVALMPCQVVDTSAWRDCIAVLDRAGLSGRVRVATFGAAAGVLGAEGAHFAIDAGELAAYLRQLGNSTSAGPPIAGLTPGVDSSRDASSKLKDLLLDGAEKSAAGEHESATESYRVARSLCKARGMLVEEAMALMASSGACLAAGLRVRAAEGYGRAAELAASMSAWPLACQALLGAGGGLMADKRYEPAVAMYRAAADAALQGDVALLRLEALRMEGVCLLAHGRSAEAAAAWMVAVEYGAGLRGEDRKASPLAQIARDLADLLNRLGLRDQAAHVATLVAAGPLVAPPPERPEPDPDVPPRETMELHAYVERDALPFAHAAAHHATTFETAPVRIADLRPALPFRPPPSNKTTALPAFDLAAAMASSAPATVAKTTAFPVASIIHAAPGRRLVRFDERTGELLAVPYWADDNDEGT